MENLSHLNKASRELNQDIIAIQLTSIVDQYSQRVSNLSHRLPDYERGVKSEFLNIHAEYDQAMIGLRETSGDELLLEGLLATRAVTIKPPFEISVSKEYFQLHFQNKAHQNFEELSRICKVLSVEDLCLEILRTDAQSWSTRRCYSDIRALTAHLGNHFARQPHMLADVFRICSSLLERAQIEDEHHGEHSMIEISSDPLIQFLKDEAELSLATLSHLLRKQWRDSNSAKPIGILCELIEETGRMGQRGVHELFRDSLEPNVALHDRREIIRHMLGADSRYSFKFGHTLDRVFHSSLSLSDDEFEYISERFRIVCSGIADPQSYIGLILLDRGAHFISSEPTTPIAVDFLSSLRQCHRDFPSIPDRLLLLVAGHLDGDRTALAKFDALCGMIGDLEAETQRDTWALLRHGLLSFGTYRDSRFFQMIEIGGIESKEDALAFARYLSESATLSTLATRYGLPFPPPTTSWTDNLNELRRLSSQIWSFSLSKSFSPELFQRMGISASIPSDESFRLALINFNPYDRRFFDIGCHPHLLPFFEYGYIHWVEANLEHTRQIEEFLETLGPVPFEASKYHRYDNSRKTVAEQLRPLSVSQQNSWIEDFWGAQVRISRNRAQTTLRLLVTDHPSILLRIGDTPLNTESCLSLSSNPNFNRALLALLQDAHQKVALFLNTARLPEELAYSERITPDLLFRYSEEIQRACVCRSVIKIAERETGDGALVQGPDYFSTKKRDKIVMREFRKELFSYSANKLGLPIFGELLNEDQGEVLSIPPTSTEAGQNEDYDGVGWSSCERGRYKIKLSRRNNST